MTVRGATDRFDRWAGVCTSDTLGEWRFPGNTGGRRLIVCPSHTGAACEPSGPLCQTAGMEWPQTLTVVYLVATLALRIVALGVVPEGRRPGSSMAWLMLILLLPEVGFPLYLLIGSPYVKGRRKLIQDAANEVIAVHSEGLPQVPQAANPDPALRSLIAMNHLLTGLPCVSGQHLGTYDTAEGLYAAMAAAVDQAEDFCHVEFYVMAWDDTTDVFFRSLESAVGRGVKVRLLMDHLGSCQYPGWRQFLRRMTRAGIDWHLMMPLQPLRGRWRRPDLRNHRKMLIIDGRVGFVGSHNLIDPAYGRKKNVRIGRRWLDLSIKLAGQVVNQLEAVFATDWFAETGEMLDVPAPLSEIATLGGSNNALQLVPSGPGFPTEPNRNQFVQLMHQATRTLTITSPYFVPDESLLTAIIGAAYRGVEVELFVGEQADQFLVGHAQRSYYTALLEAGVRILLYPAPTVLHAKYCTIDGKVAVLGSSNMDFRSFALNYETMLLTFGGDLTQALLDNDAAYRAVSRELTLEEWAGQPWFSRYVDNVCRLASAVV